MINYRLDYNSKIYPNIDLKNRNKVSNPAANSVTNKKAKILSKKTDSMLPLIAGGAVAAGLLLVGLAARKKISHASIKNVIQKPDNIEENLWKNLNFKKADTMEDAASYARDVLGIKFFQLENNLEAANWINEGLTNLQNIYKGKFKMPDAVAFLTSKHMQSSPMAIIRMPYSKLMHLVINKDFLKSTESLEHINTLLKGLEEKGALAFSDGKYKFSIISRDRYIQLFEDLAELKKRTRNFNPFEIHYMARGLDSYTNMCCYQNAYKDAFENLFKDADKIKKIKDKIPNFPSAEKIREMSVDEMADLIYDIYKKAGISLDCQYGVHSFNKFDLLYHEGGHLLHEKQIPGLFYKYHNSANVGCIPPNASKELLDFFNNAQKQQIADRISDYAKHSPVEFVAEVHIGLCNGYKFSDDVIELYKSYGGPIPPV